MISRTEHDPHGKGEGKAITMAMVAKAAGVSQGAISSLLNDRDYGIRVSARTREKVFRVCREMGYLPNDLRAIVRMYPERGNLYLLLDETAGQHPLATTLIQPLLQHAPGHHVGLSLYHPGRDYSNVDQLPEVVRNGVASQFIALGKAAPSLFSALAAREFAVVHIGDAAPADGVSHLIPDYHAAAALALGLLFERKHERIAILSGPFGSSAHEVISLNQGVQQAYEAHGLPVEARNILYGPLTLEQGVSAIDLLWNRPDRPTALFCFSDLVAAGAMRRARELGAHIPSDLTIIGCGDASFGPWLQPPLTTVGFAPEPIAQMALEEIHERFQSADFVRTSRRSLPPVLIERSSTHQPPGSPMG